MKRVFIDSTVPIYAVGGPSPHKDACLAVLDAAARGEIELHASVEMVQEFLFHRMRRGDRGEAVRQARTVTSAVVLHDFDDGVLHEALGLVERHGLRGRDAIYAATALRNGFTEILTSDPDFNHCPGLTRLDPASAC